MRLPLKRLLIYCCMGVLISSGCSTPVESGGEAEAGMTDEQIVELTDRVIQWQLDTYPEEKWGKSWRDATLFIGITGIAKILNQDSYWEIARKWAGRQDWEIGSNRQHADDQAVGQVYLQFYEREGDDYMIRDFKRWIDVMIAKQITGAELWNWCDALFMSPPALAHLASLTGQEKYVEFLNEKFWESKEFLYDPEHHLFFRDHRFFGESDARGNPVFWSRGNGWVVAGLARIMSHLPRENLHYKRYRSLFMEMMDKLAAIQPEDGLWRTNLLSPGLYPTPDVSGTSLISYALGWGINEKILTDDKYVVAFRKSWSGLVQKVGPDGKLGYAQKPGDRPGTVDKDNSEIFAAGAFLLAAGEALRAEEN
ncbi:MAG: glycoside hydrolase family 88 protein [Balneolaceae bacterium]